MSEEPALILITEKYSYEFEDFKKYQSYDTLNTLPAFDDSSVTVFTNLNNKKCQRE